MNKKIVILFGIIIFILIIVLIVNKNKRKENVTQNLVKTLYNEDEKKYVVYDETGKEVYNGTNRAEAEFRKKHPDFNPRI